MRDATDTGMGIELKGVSKSFGDTLAVRDLSLRIPPGQVLGFLGPNGAGKTTTIKMLMGLLRRDTGLISVLGMHPSAQATAVKMGVGYVPEQHLMHRWMRVEEVLAFCRTFYPTWNPAQCATLVELFRLDPRKRVKHLSKGMLVKLSLVVALAHEPRALILDEPMAGLDPLVREELLDGVLQTSSDRPRTILFSSHTLADVQRMADAVAIIDEGELLVHSTVDDLLGGTKRIRAVLSDGSAPSEAPETTIWQRVQQREWLLTVRDFSTDVVERLRSRNSLENVEVIDLGLEEIYKDHVRGRRNPECTKRT